MGNPKSRHGIRAKLDAIAVGQVVYLPHEHIAGGPSSLERNVKTQQGFIPARFKTSRCDVVTAAHELETVLRIERVE
jgi:hypothetical protein